MKLFDNILKLLLIFAMIPQVSQAFDFREGGLCYNMNEDGKSVTLTYETLILFAHDAPAPVEKGYTGHIVIPEKVEHEGKTYKVTAIGREAFMGNSELYSVYIPPTVQTIGKGAFMQCRSLKEVILPPDLPVISDYMFAESNLSTINIPNKVEVIGNSAFSNCYLKSITIPNSVKKIGKSAFSACRWMEKVNLGNSLETIGEAAFSICTKLSAVSLPASLTEIGPKAFFECSGIESIVIPARVSSIGEGVFSSCHGLKTVKVEKKNKKYDLKSQSLVFFPFHTDCSRLFPVSEMADRGSVFHSITNYSTKYFGVSISRK